MLKAHIATLPSVYLKLALIDGPLTEALLGRKETRRRACVVYTSVEFVYSVRYLRIEQKVVLTKRSSCS